MARLKPKIGLALGSGGARGLAHIGVIKVLEENEIPIDVISGTSIGSLVGGFYAANLDIKEIEKLALSTQGRKTFQILAEPHLKQSLTGKEDVITFIENYLGKKTFEDCHIPFSAVATDLINWELVVLNRGELTQAIRASISVPIAFRPVKIESRTLADGGLSMPVPVDVARDMGADVVIAVNLDNPPKTEPQKSSRHNLAQNSLKIMSYHLAMHDCKKADVVINVDVGVTPWFKFTDSQSKIDNGERATREILPQLKRILS